MKVIYNRIFSALSMRENHYLSIGVRVALHVQNI